MVLLQSRWPRFGLGQSDIVPGRCLGRFAAVDDLWVFEKNQDGMYELGQGEPLSQLDRILGTAAVSHPHAGAIGYVAYEAGYGWVGLGPPETGTDIFFVPQMQFLVFDSLGVVKPERGPEPVTLRGRTYPRDRLLALVNSPGVHRTVEKRCYLSAIRQIKRHIRAGDIYQANYTQAFDIRTERGGTEIYEDLAASNPAPFAAYLRFPPLRWELRTGETMAFPEVEIISNSPERFWKKTGALVETRPIKGTIARGDTPQADRGNRRQLLMSQKDRAELLMITDLERNDLGRFAAIGSVKVEALRRTRACPSIWHLESLVTACAHPSVRWHHIMQSMFPGGSITGAPKRRAMEILRDLEVVARGVYCGAIGWVNAAGDADFSIAIRTAVKVGENVRLHGGGGIVADSDPEAEYEESLVKIAPMVEYLCR
jgi:anthranilate/para-aminobenzoate synthase component I